MVGYYWNRFEKTGDIQDYLHYACASEEAQNEGRRSIEAGREGQESYEQRNLIGNGTVSDTRWRVR